MWLTKAHTSQEAPSSISGSGSHLNSDELKIFKKDMREAFQKGAESEFVRQLEYKANWYGRKIIKVPTFYPSSKTCSSCGNVKETLTLSERIYHCEYCGIEIDRDYNASINILRKGLEILKEEKVS